MPGRTLRRRITALVAAIIATLAIGTIGFTVIENYSAFDAFYMTLITISTVGYRELHPLSRAGRLFNSFLVLFGVGVMFFAIGAMTQSIVELQLSEFFGRRRIKKMIEKLHDHFIVCGYGRVGRAAAEELRRSGAPSVVIDSDPAEVERAVKRGMLGVVADAKSDETLRELGIERAKGLIAALASDADNLFLIISAKALNSKLIVSSRVSEQESAAKLKSAGADAVFRPYGATGYRLAQAILRPFVFEFLEFTTSLGNLGNDIGLEQIKVSAGSPLSSKSLRDMALRKDLDVIVLAIRKADGAMRFNPPADAVVEADDHIVVLGNVRDLRKLGEQMRGA